MCRMSAYVPSLSFFTQHNAQWISFLSAFSPFFSWSLAVFFLYKEYEPLQTNTDLCLSSLSCFPLTSQVAIKLIRRQSVDNTPRINKIGREISVLRVCSTIY